MNIDAYLPGGMSVEELLILMMALSAGSVAITVWFTLLQRDPALRRAKVIAAQRSAMRNALVGPRRRQQRLPTLGMMRQVVDRLNLLKSGQAERISQKLMRAGWRSKDAIIRYLFMKLFRTPPRSARIRSANPCRTRSTSWSSAPKPA
jgi:tight adherence protein C